MGGGGGGGLHAARSFLRSSMVPSGAPAPHTKRLYTRCAFPLPHSHAIVPWPSPPSYVPSLNWLDKAQRQANKHLETATGAHIAALLWAWGEFGYTPNDKLFMNRLKVCEGEAMA